MSLGNIGIRISGNFSSTASLLPDDKPSNPDIPKQLNTNSDKTNPHLLDNNLNSMPKLLSKNIERPLATTLQAASAAGDDRSLISHGSDRKYWYSIGDGYRLLLAIRKNKLTYKNEAKIGEEYSASRENDKHILITDPYHIDNFDSSLEDDIKKITGSHEISALNRQWGHPPKIIIIPVLTGCHWRCLRIKMDYMHGKITILFDDPYGKYRFEEKTKSDLKDALRKHIGRLIAYVATQRNDTNFQLSQMVFNAKDKEINQQGIGNGYDCGPIIFCNIADYTDTHKKTQDLSQGIGLRITKASDISHEESMITMRTLHIREYAEVADIRLDETRLVEIKTLMQKENQAKLEDMRKRRDIDEAMQIQIFQLPTESISMVFNAMELGLSVRDAYDSVKAEHYNKHISDNMILLASSPTLLSPSTDHSNKTFSVSELEKSVPSNPIVSVESRLAIHLDHRNLKNLSLSLPEMKQLLEEVQNNKLIGHITWGKLPSGKKAKNLCRQIEQVIIENNKIYRRYPSDFIHGILSLHAYRDARADTPVIFQSKKAGKEEKYERYNSYITQWTVHSVHNLPEQGGYYGVIYKNVQTRQLVLAHRGTERICKDLFKKQSDLKTDIKGILGGQIVSQQEAAYNITKGAAAYAKKHHYHFSTTGHSLGAWLAEYSVYFSEAVCGKAAKAVTFDSPGSSKMEFLLPNIINNKNKVDIKNLDITTYLSDPNFVNTCSEHVGTVYRVYPIYPKLKSNRLVGAKIKGLGSLVGHLSGPIIATFDPETGKPKKFDEMARWPLTKYTAPEIGGNTIISETVNIPKKILNKLNPLQKSTIAGVMNLFGDVLTGRIDQTQYLKCYEILSTYEKNPTEEVWNKHLFSMTYEGSYEFAEIDSSFVSPLISGYNENIGGYLKKLYDCPTEKIAQTFGKNSLITVQLQDIQALYKIDSQTGSDQVIATQKTPVEEIRERLLRIIEVMGGKDGKVASFLNLHQQKLSQPSFSFALTSYLPPPLGKQYILREKYVNKIDEILKTHPYVVISSEPGFGKTTLATEYGRKEDILHKSTVVIKIDADSREKINEAYRRIAVDPRITERQDPDMIMRLVNGKIKQHKKKVVLIFDNVEKYDDAALYITNLPSNAKALITTREYELFVKESIIKIQPFTYEEAEQYIQSSAIQERIKNLQEVKALVKHYARNTDHVSPYHLKRAIALIKATPSGNITTYLRNIEKYQNDEGEIRLQQKLMTESKLAWPILQYAAFLDPDGIDLQIFTQLFGGDEDELNEAIKVLESLSAMYRVWKNGQVYLSLHRLTQNIVGDFIKNSAYKADCMDKAEILLKLAKNLNILCPTIDDNPKNWPQAKKLMPHIERVLDCLPETVIGAQIAELWTKIGDYAKNIGGLYSKAVSCYEKALAMQKQLYPDQSRFEVASALNNLSLGYIKLGGEDNYKRSIERLEQALKIWQVLYPEQSHSETATSFNYLGMAYLHLDNKKALIPFKRALAMYQRLHKNQPHLQIAQILTNLGCVYGSLEGIENRKKSLALQEKALVMMRALYHDQPHPDLASILHEVGHSYRNLGGVDNIRKGFVFKEQALVMKQTFYNDQPHPHVAILLNSIGNSYCNLGGVENIEKGIELLERALAMLKALYDEQPHLDVVTSLDNLGNVYQDLGGAENSKKGLDLQEQALAMQKVLYANRILR